MKATKQNFITTAEGIPGNWAKWSGGAGSADTSLDYDGGDPVPDILAGPATFDDIEISRTYDPIVDAGWIRDLRRKIGRSRHTLTKFSVDMNWIAVGDPDTYPNCVLKGIQEPETDASSGDASELVLKFATTGPA
ncbi:tail tube protein [Arthrobacter phage Bumble]|uniref:Tail tube protein n=1 Tax=Arthrobacter phage Bumble TaxID=2743904 RepID=A0A7G3VAA1_9CAUD|nr:tail tube protein [Arthrobacter phage Bumble]